ncbi:hypothetical protein [Pseudodesulfovibrio sediminis]|uniref:Uncharacterized protein n=1 Tax=Pseudodesulfovibrio sediminis TaxID=2810563 RepID=A0ABM7P5I7_9BACT|nr:hypothetical protein [Pseudodesulfovibrio sediminis]BCS88196.1 hypothetical protein PSDVSF_14380 [Pseudodesulfovibrio sediminis]
MYYKLFLVLLLSLFIVAGTSSVVGATESLADMNSRARDCGVAPDVLDHVRTMIKEGDMDKDAGVSLLLPLLTACDKKLPLAPLEDKLAEGLVKHVAVPLIVRVLNKKVDDYDFARSLLAAHVKPVPAPLLIVVGEGLSRGVPRQDVTAYVEEFSGQAPESFLVGAEMLSYLGQIDFRYDLVRSMLAAGFESGGIESQWRYFVRLVVIARQRGVSDESIAAAATEALRDCGVLSDVSTKLGFTSRSLTGNTGAE